MIAEAESYLAKHYNSEYYDIVAKSCEAEKKAENSNYDKLKQDLQTEHKQRLNSLKDAEDIKDRKVYIIRINCLMLRWHMNPESRRSKTEDMMHLCISIHLIDLLRMSKFTFAQKRIQSWENYKYIV